MGIFLGENRSNVSDEKPFYLGSS